MVLKLIARCGEQERVRIELKVVMMAMKSMRAIRIDDEWRQKFAALQE